MYFGEYEKALEGNLKAMEITKKILGENHLEYAELLLKC
jgi:hypothetical protein